MEEFSIYVWFVNSINIHLFQLAHGADPSMKNQEGQTPLDLATVSKTEEFDYLTFAFSRSHIWLIMLNNYIKMFGVF